MGRWRNAKGQIRLLVMLCAEPEPESPKLQYPKLFRV